MIPITVRGNLGADPELKFKDDLAITTLRLAHTPRIKEKGEWHDGEVMWFRVTIFGPTAEGAAGLFKKGDAVLVVGKFRQVSYEKDGVERQGLEITADEVAAVVVRFIKSKAATTDEPAW